MKPRLLLPIGIVLSGALTNLCAQEAKVVEKEGRVVMSKAGAKPAPAEIGAELAARDKLGTGESSRAVLKMSDKWFARIDEETDVEITPGAFNAKDKEALKVAMGGAFIYSREEEGELKIQTPSATGGLRGTQLVVRVLPGGKTLMKVIEGEVEMSNAHGRVLLKAGEAGDAESGRAPRKTAVIQTRNILQWALYYPAVLQPDELGLSAAEQRTLAASLSAYREGDLLGALAKYPSGHAASSNAGKLYRAAVLLATGQVDDARTAMSSVPKTSPGARALERMIAAVHFLEQPDAGEMTTASEWIAESYYQQSRSNLEAAREAARRATELAPTSGFTWTRLAEMEFSFGRTRQARSEVEKGMMLAPRNAQAHALRGYLLSAQNDIKDARASFEEAIRLDGGLGNGWLGLGLTKIKQGQLEEGRMDIQTAVTVEPTRSFLYSYHGKALSMEGWDKQARKDLEIAKTLDPNDPTPWLYSAILNQQENRYNPAISDLQESLALNDNRRVYRSKFLLDQDRAVRNTSLARVYHNNGMTDLAIREATRAVENDYTNAAAHLFLANSLDALRDPKRVSLRYETAFANELLLAYLLSPVGGGPLSQFISQQEYSKLLEADGFGGGVAGEFRDDGYKEVRASLFATQGRLSLGMDFLYRFDNGSRPNNESSISSVYAQMKYQVSPDDIFYAIGAGFDDETGDLLSNYYNQPTNLNFDSEEKQEPGILLAGWNHRWGPGSHTLFLGGRLASEQVISGLNSNSLILERGDVTLPDSFYDPFYIYPTNPDGSIKATDEIKRDVAPILGKGSVTDVYSGPFNQTAQRQFEIYTAEIQHIWQTELNTLLVGGKWQRGEFETNLRLDLQDPTVTSIFYGPAARQDVSVNFERQTIYAYDFLRLTRWLMLIGGISWDHMDRPENFRFAPASEGEVESERLSGKAGFTFTPSRWFTIRGAYTEAQGGVSFDESIRLEPVQIAGFNQAFRSVISESLIGAVEAPIYKNIGISMDGSFPTRTWWSVSFNILEEDVDRTVGSFDLFYAPVFPSFVGVFPSGTKQRLEYREEVLTATLNQLIGDEFAVGVGYRYTDSELRNSFSEIPASLIPGADVNSHASLHEATVYGTWNSPTGLFARADAVWYSQDLDNSVAGQHVDSLPGDDFWQLNANIGYRFNRNLCEVSVGVLNILDTDYQLSPLTYTREIARERTFFVRYRFSF